MSTGGQASMDAPISPGWNRGKCWILFLILSGTTIQAIDRSTLSVANSIIAGDLHFSLGTMGIALSSFGWAYFLGNLPAGRLCDRYGAKKVYALGAALWSVASACTGLATGLWSLIASRIFVGFGESVNFPAATKVVSERFAPSERGTATGIYIAGLPVGFALAPIVMIWLMTAFGSVSHPNWRIAFLLTGIGSLIWVILWALTFKDTNAPQRNTATARSPEKEQVPLSVLLKFRNAWALVVIKFTNDYLYYLFVFWLPGYLVYARHFNLKQLAFYATAPFVAGSIARVLTGLLMDKLIHSGLNPNLTKKTLAVVPQVISLTAVLLAARAETAVVAAWWLVLALAGESGGAVAIWVLPQDLAARGTGGSLGGLSNTSGALSSILSPIITGFIAQYFGFSMAFVIGAIIMAGSCLSTMFFLTEFAPLNITEADLAASRPAVSPTR